MGFQSGSDYLLALGNFTCPSAVEVNPRGKRNGMALF